MTEIRGFPVVQAGTYVLMDDVVAALKEYAESVDSLAVAEAAQWLEAGLPAPAVTIDGTAEEGPSEPSVFGAEPDDVSEGVDRVEIFPDNPDDPRPRWHARSIDTGGYILKTTNGSFDQARVIQNAEERWPGIPIHLLKHAGEDSKWVEDATRGAFPSLGPPMRRLFAGVGTYEREVMGGVETK